MHIFYAVYFQEALIWLLLQLPTLVQRLVFFTSFFSKTRRLHMKVLIAGSRFYSDYQKILAVVRSLDIDLVIAGG
jgi:hypothetical protein